MGDKVFISYRRTDAEAEAGRVAERLRAEFGGAAVFFDTESIAPGESFPTRLETELDRARVVLVIIGGAWLTAADEWGRRRIDDPKDWVRTEVRHALKMAGVDVIPVLVGTADTMPPAHALPDDLAELSDRNAVRIQSGRFSSDIQTLTSHLVRLGMRQVQCDPLAAVAAPGLVDWNVIGTRCRAEHQKTCRMWEVATLVLVAISLLVPFVKFNSPEGIAFSGVLLVFALVPFHISRQAAAKCTRAQNLMDGLNATKGTSQFGEWDRRAREVFA